MKGKTSRTLQLEYNSFKKKYRGKHLWASDYFCRSVGNVTKKIIQDYIENQQNEEDEYFKIVV